MTLFLDNDVLEKLASWQLLEDGVQACGSAAQDVRVLPTLKFRLGLAGKKLRPKYPEDVLDRIRSLLEKAQECSDAPPAGRTVLSDVPNLDAGEAILFAHAAESKDALLLTGDKRSIEAVATVPACADLVREMATLPHLPINWIPLDRLVSQGDAAESQVVNLSFQEVHQRFGSPLLIGPSDPYVYWDYWKTVGDSRLRLRFSFLEGRVATLNIRRR